MPSDAVVCIERFLAENYRPGFTIVFEIARKEESGIWVPDMALLAYFRRLGSRTIDFRYRYPILQTYDGAASYPADLMVRLPDGRSLVTGSEVRTILRCLYFRHYLRWDRPFLAPARLAERERLIDKLYSQEVASLGDDDVTIETHGDDRRSHLFKCEARPLTLVTAIARLFGPKLPRLTAVIVLVLAVQAVLGNFWLLVPFVPVVAALYCLVDNSEGSRKPLRLVFTKFSVVPRRQS